MLALSMPKYSYFMIICEIYAFITWLKGGLKVAERYLKVLLKSDLKVG